MSALATLNHSAQQMTSLEIAELVGSRHDNVKRAIERLARSGVIQLPPMEDFEKINNLGHNIKVAVYVFSGEQGKRDSIVVVAQLCPEFTAKLVDRWQELEFGTATPIVKAKRQSNNLGTLTRQCVIMAKACGLQGNQAILSADMAVQKLTGESPLQLLGATHLYAPIQEQTYSPTEIGKLLSPTLKPHAVNLVLEEMGFQVKEGKSWIACEPGQSLSEVLDTGKKQGAGTPVKQLKWYRSVVDLIQSHLDKSAQGDLLCTADE